MADATEPGAGAPASESAAKAAVMTAPASLQPPPYARGELVWSKLYGFPWWPSQVRSVRDLKKPQPDEEPKMRVRFFHTKDNASLPLSKILPYAPNLAELSVIKKKMFKSKGAQAKFEAALQDAEAAAAIVAEGGQPVNLIDDVKPADGAAAAERDPATAWSDDDVVDDDDVEAAREEAALSLDKWQSDGHALIGAHVARYFGPADYAKGGKAAGKRKVYLATITRWFPSDEEPLFHAVHDDGDEEDLDEQEARKGAAVYSRQDPKARRKHELHVARLERARRAEWKARQPRKPRSAFQLFSAELRPELAAANPVRWRTRARTHAAGKRAQDASPRAADSRLGRVLPPSRATRRRICGPPSLSPSPLLPSHSR
jgi:hypothetical protein